MSRRIRPGRRRRNSSATRGSGTSHSDCLQVRDAIDGAAPQRTLQQMWIDDVVTAPISPWQNPFVERLIGSLRRECLDHVIVWNEHSLHRHFAALPRLLSRVAYSSLAGQG